MRGQRMTIASMLLGGAFLLLLSCVSVGAGVPPEKRKRVAAVVTTYYHNSHADIIASRMLQTNTLDGKGEWPKLELASVYTDQVPENDLSRPFSAKYGSPIYDTVADTLTLGTGKLAVDGVLLIAEHGDYPPSETGSIQYPKRRLFEQIVKVFEDSGRVVPVFVDKHLADNWKDAKWIYDTALTPSPRNDPGVVRESNRPQRPEGVLR